MAGRPTGTVTFLFTDIEGSTRLLQNLGAGRYRTVLEEHRRLLREMFQRFQGHEVDTQGDAFFVAFGRAQDAARAAEQGRRALAAGAWPEGRELRVRMGLHTCEAVVTNEGYVGIGVHRGARICAAAHGGQILLSETTRDLIADSDVKFDLRDLGEYRLKDLPGLQRVFELRDAAAPVVFPPLRTLESRPMSLPPQVTPFVGRTRELDDVKALLRREGARLVTLTGPGGTGKTRLALEAAAELADDYPDGTFFVPLAGVTEPEMMLPAVTRALGMEETSGGSLAAHLGAKTLLLLADNFEHLVSAAPQVAELLTAAPKLQIVATSREPLRVAAERVYPVSPLHLPDSGRLPPLPDLSRYEAVALFVQRAVAAQPDFALTAENAPSVAELCRRLDGLPLAIELAAARIPLLSPAGMLRRMNDRFAFLKSGVRDVAARQQTLHATVAWSYDLLTEEERELVCRLTAFSGGFTVEAAEEVAGAELDRLAALIDKSWIRREGERLGMLETLRLFAAEQLRESGGEQLIRRRHAEYFLALARSANLTMEAEGAQRYDLIISERENVHGALEWTVQSGETELGLLLAVALEQYWVGNSPIEGKRLLGELLVRAGSVSDSLRASALRALGAATYIAGGFEEGVRLIAASADEYRRLGDERALAETLHLQAMESLRRGELAQARTLQEEGLGLHRKYNSQRGEALALRVFAELAMHEGDSTRAIELLVDSAAAAERAGFIWWQMGVLLRLATILLDLDRAAESEQRFLAALALASRIGDRPPTLYALAALARTAAARGQHRRALSLWGAVETEQARFPTLDWARVRNQHAAIVLGDGGQELDRGQPRGAPLTLEEAVNEALAVVPALSDGN